jgi:hypothetical protein
MIEQFDGTAGPEVGGCDEVHIRANHLRGLGRGFTDVVSLPQGVGFNASAPRAEPPYITG